MNRAGTEYFTIRTVIIEDRSTRGVSDQTRVEPFRRQRCQERLLGGEVLADGADPVIDPPVLVLGFPLPGSGRSAHRSDSATGIGDSRLRRNQPTSPSTPPFS